MQCSFRLPGESARAGLLSHRSGKCTYNGTPGPYTYAGQPYPGASRAIKLESSSPSSAFR